MNWVRVRWGVREKWWIGRGVEERVE